MPDLPKPLADLIEALSLLPGVGPRSAERYANSLIKRGPNVSQKLSDALDNLNSKIKICPRTFALISSDESRSRLYDDPKRDKTIIAVVAEPFDIYALEKTNHFAGTYHVIGGLISPLDNIAPEDLHIKELLARIKEDKVGEVIIATNASVEGETTALYIKNQIKNPKIQVTRLARGLPIGVDLEYADMITLTKALEGRQRL